MEYIDDILCIEFNELVPEFMSQAYYNKLRGERRYLSNETKLNVVRRGCRGTTAMIEFTSLPPKYQEAYKKIYGDPIKNVRLNILKSLITEDENAREFFNEYQFDGKYLPDAKKKEYYNNAIILNAVIKLINERKAYRKARSGSVKNVLDTVVLDINRLDKSEYPHSMPQSKERIRKVLYKYKKNGYSSLISGKLGNKNPEKINDDAKIWLIALWSNHVDKVPTEMQLMDKYNERAALQGWKHIKNVGTIHNFLHSPEIKNMWYGHRYGELKAKEKYSYQHSTIMPSMRDSLWYSDGTKLNYYYLDHEGKVSTCQVYEVMDVFSEVLLGYHISKTEDFEAQYHAYKMAIKKSGQKPYEIKYDNQGGHKKLENGDFLTKLSRLSIKTTPYNGKSKTIESAFGRFQSQYLKKDWYFTGQNIQAKKEESKANMEFIMANKSNLPSLEQIKERYFMRREEWNNAKHHQSGMRKVEMYYQSENPKAVKIDIWDMVDMFWITRPKPVTCTAYGISFTEKGSEYQYMVCLKDNKPDMEWLRKNIDKKFHIKYDPDDMSIIYLYEMDHAGLRFVKAAETKVNIHRNTQEQEDFEAEFIRYVENENKRVRLQTRDSVDKILETHNLLPEQHGLNSPVIKGVESARKKKNKSASIAKVQKQLSNVVEGEDDYDENDIYNMY